MQIEGMFDVPHVADSCREWEVDIPHDEKAWNIGLIVGPSGCGKTTIATEIFGSSLIKNLNWDASKSIVDDFPDDVSIKDITSALSSVGFSSPPSWLRPFNALSNGEQFRVTLARAMVENHDLFCVDEFTSVVDRTVAKIGSAAIAKAVRRKGSRFVAVGCHYDVIEWLDPDWVYEPLVNRFQWRLERRRPPINLVIRRVHHSCWKIFKEYHYLSGELNKSSICFAAFVDEDPAAFVAVLSMPHANGGMWREHRTVCRPDYQGVGIGNALSEYVASLFSSTGKSFVSTTSSPAMIKHRDRSPKWTRTRSHSFASPLGKTSGLSAMKNTISRTRMTSGFRYIGEKDKHDAVMFGIGR